MFAWRSSLPDILFLELNTEGVLFESSYNFLFPVIDIYYLTQESLNMFFYLLQKAERQS